MEIYWGTENINPSNLVNAVVTIGNFDGCHVGHQEIFRRTKTHAERIHGQSVVYTFNPHPASVVQGSTPQLIFTVEEKIEAMRQLGIDHLVIVPFTRELADTEPEAFVNKVLLERMHAHGIVIGYDFCFGRKATGNYAFLQEMGKRRGFFVERVQQVVQEDIVVSSTKIREILQSGDVALAARLLSRPFVLTGTVVHGMSRGRTLGYPTANIRPHKNLIPPYGVYAAFVYQEGKRHLGVVNIGNNPTFGDEGTSIEVFIFDFDGDLYGSDIAFEFIERLRGEIRFDDKEHLIAQIEKDCESANKILREKISNP